MLDSETKRKIDTCRDILVGKLPDPKSQIEQITIALIYKFMDDMDKQSEELGGKPKFFTGEFEKYSWSNLVSPKISGHELISYYNESLLKMNQNKNIPQLFRDIFKNAYLPYRDPETLKSFLKEIDWFNYDHSEKLGDAFEYLLSVMGSQGDAGQFRTPRNIIDFIVEVVNPDKNESVLDPACGTAGFLISAYKHILNKYRDKNGKINLTPDDKKRLINNFVGYDISPDMVRLSLVNLYLHGFPDPKIFEYDTLTSEERWNEHFEVIMTNPPFMTPKGGIKPHKRFSVQANRSEVLFVDYIAEHLTHRGRAGIVVPEGIIFQSGNAYKDLRKMLLENSLYAVISLPAGVFNPYSGVKTSILLLDKSFVKKTDKILFIKIENDGFGLGAQRREVSGSDLPIALEIINKYKDTIKNGKEKDFELNALEQKKALIIKKGELAEDFNLSQDRYRTQEVYSGNWPLVGLGEVCEIVKDKPQKYEGQKKYYSTGSVDIGDTNSFELVTYENKPSRADMYPKINDVGFAVMKGTNKVILIDEKYAGSIFSTGFAFLRCDDKIKSNYLYFIIKNNYFQNKKDEMAVDGIMGGIRKSDIEKIKIPLPPIEVQEKIIAELESYQKIIDGARLVVGNYKPFIAIKKDWKTYKIEETCEITTGKLDANAAEKGGKYPFFTCSKTDIFKINTYAFDCEALLLSGNNASGDFDVKYYNGKFNAYQRTYIITIKEKFKDKITYPLLNYYLENSLLSLKKQSIGGLTKYLTKNMITSIDIQVPPLEIQKQIVSRIEEEQKLVDSNKNLIEIFDKKIKDKISEVWSEKEGEGDGGEMKNRFLSL